MFYKTLRFCTWVLESEKLEIKRESWTLVQQKTCTGCAETWYKRHAQWRATCFEMLHCKPNEVSKALLISRTEIVPRLGATKDMDRMCSEQGCSHTLDATRVGGFPGLRPMPPFFVFYRFCSNVLIFCFRTCSLFFLMFYDVYRFCSKKSACGP